MIDEAAAIAKLAGLRKVTDQRSSFEDLSMFRDLSAVLHKRLWYVDIFTDERLNILAGAIQTCVFEKDYRKQADNWLEEIGMSSAMINAFVKALPDEKEGHKRDTNYDTLFGILPKVLEKDNVVRAIGMKPEEITKMLINEVMLHY